MADRRDDGDLSSSSSGRTNADEIAHNSNPDPSSYSAYLAWTQYWQYYYTYSFYYYSYYYLLAQQGHGSATAFQSSSVSHATAGHVSAPRNQPEIGQRLLNEGWIRPPVGGQANTQQERYEYTVASLWKRIIAEFIDFVFLYFIKYVLFSVYYKDPYYLNAQLQYILIVDESTSFKDVENVLMQALVYRLVVFIYEAFFVAVPFPCRVGGATLGKYMMGITVISYQGLIPIQGHNLRHFAGNAPRRLLWWQACVRAVFKNFLITFFFPIMFTAMFLQNYRTPYDLMASSVVVDAYPRRLPLP